MQKITSDDIDYIKRHPIGTMVVMAIDIVMLPIHLAFILTDKIAFKTQELWKNRK